MITKLLRMFAFAEHSVANHQSWLLKTTAIELRVTTLNRQRSHTQRLMKLILDDYDEDQTSGILVQMDNIIPEFSFIIGIKPVFYALTFALMLGFWEDDKN